MSDIARKLQDEGIRLQGGVRQGNHKALCPKCSHTRRKKTDPCLSVTIDGDGAVWNCHNSGCGFAGSTAERKSDVIPMRRKIVKPVYQAPDALPANVLAWFEKRGISLETLKRNRIGYGLHFIPGAGKEVNAIQFPYLRGGEVVNVKYRDGEKHFCQAKDAEKIFYGLDDVAGMDIAIIVEGEMDKLACEEAGIRNVLSVPDGAPGKLKETASPDDKKFEYIGNSWAQLEHVKTFVLAVDNDEPGKVLEEELARRLGREKCLRVSWPTAGDAPCKDANEVLMTHGADVLRECIDLAAPYPIRNLVDIGTDETDILTLYHEGYAKAFSTGWPCLDDYLKIRVGELSVITGTPGSGKSEWIDALMVNLAENEGWKFAVCSFENPVATHRSKLIEKRMRLPFWPGPSMRMSEPELRQGAAWVREHFHFMQFADDAPTIDAILDTARGAVRRYGIKGLVIDPYNEIEHKRPPAMTETEYVSEMLGKVKRLAQNHDVHVWFVAHPGKLPRDRDGKRGIPGLYDISGSANWVNKADIGIVVHRDPTEKPPTTEIHIRKVRFRAVGQLGTVKLAWDKKTGRYSDPVDTQREYYDRRYEPDHVNAYNNRGNVLQRMKRYEEALASYDQAIALQPDHASAYCNRGVTLQELNRPDEALASLDKAIMLKPDYIEAYNNRAVTLQKMTRYDESLASCHKAIDLKPDCVDAHNNRGVTLQKMKRYDDAMACYAQAIAFNPDCAEAYNNRGLTLQEMKQRDEALVSYDKAIVLKPDNAEAYNNRCLTLQELKRYDDALVSCDKSIALKPDYVEAWQNRGVTLVSKGDMQGAEKAFLKVLALKSDYPKALFSLVNIRKYHDADHADIKTIQILLDNPDTSLLDREFLYFALGKIYDDCNLYDDAFECYRQANQIVNAEAAYNPAGVVGATNSIIDVFNKDALAQTLGSNSQTPIFIVGMPRSGTTLMASILSNHAAIGTAGELPTITESTIHLPKFIGIATPYPQVVKQLTPIVAMRLTHDYEKRLRRDVGQDIPYVIDKNPLNFRHLGFISMLFPKARIIHCTRHPLDIGLSNYFRRFALDYSYSFDLRNIGHFYGEYARIMEHWRKVLSTQIIEISYEDMIMNTESMVRRTLHYLGLEWDERCLAPHTNPCVVDTASNWQVRQPIYTQSLERWRQYEKHLTPMKEMLQLAGQYRL